jgi:hypothetical protein
MELDQNQNDDGEMSQATPDIDTIAASFGYLDVQGKGIAFEEKEDPIDSIANSFGKLNLKRRRDSGCEMGEDEPSNKKVFDDRYLSLAFSGS